MRPMPLAGMAVASAIVASVSVTVVVAMASMLGMAGLDGAVGRRRGIRAAGAMVGMVGGHRAAAARGGGIQYIPLGGIMQTEANHPRSAAPKHGPFRP